MLLDRLIERTAPSTYSCVICNTTAKDIPVTLVIDNDGTKELWTVNTKLCTNRECLIKRGGTFVTHRHLTRPAGVR